MTPLYHDHFQNFKKYGLPKAQLIIADISVQHRNQCLWKQPKMVHRRRQQKRHLTPRRKTILRHRPQFQHLRIHELRPQNAQTRTQTNQRRPSNDRILLVRTTIPPHHGSEKTRAQPLHQPSIPQKNQPPSPQSKHAHRRKLRIRIAFVP